MPVNKLNIREKLGNINTMIFHENLLNFERGSLPREYNCICGFYYTFISYHICLLFFFLSFFNWL